MEVKEMKKVAKELAALIGVEIATAGVTAETLVEGMKEALEQAGGIEEFEASPTLLAALVECEVIEGEAAAGDDPEDAGLETPKYPDEYPAPDKMTKEEFGLLKEEFEELKGKETRDEDEEARFEVVKGVAAAVNAYLAEKKGKKKAAATPAEAPATPPLAEEPEKELTLEDYKALGAEMNVVLKFAEDDKMNVGDDAELEELKTDIIDTLEQIEATDFVARKGKETFSEKAANMLRRLGCTKVPAKKAAKAGKAAKAPKAPGERKKGPRTDVAKTAFGHWANSTRGKMDLALEKGGTFKEIAEACGVTEGKVHGHISNLKKQDGTAYPKVNVSVDKDSVKCTAG